VSEKITLFIPNGNIREVQFTARKCKNRERKEKQTED
jgi:hypothetical protein